MADPADSRAMGPLSAVRWWAGWHPVATTVAGGGLLGFLLANALVTWWLRWLGTVADGADVVRAAVAPTAGLLCLGLAVGAGTWFLGAREVKRRYPRGPAAFVDRHRAPVDPRHVSRAPGADDGDERSPPLLDVPGRVPGVSLSFGPDALALRDVTVDVAARRLRPEGDERRVPYERIATADREGDAVTVTTEGGETYRFDVWGDPAATLHELRGRVPALAERPATVDPAGRSQRRSPPEEERGRDEH